MMTKKQKIIDIILKVTEVGQEYTTPQIEARVFDFKTKNASTQVKQVPHINAFPMLIKSSKAFNRRDTRSGIGWRRK